MLPADPAALQPWLFSLRRSGVRPSLAPLKAVLEVLPGLAPRTVQVVGTVGKGSVSATIASLLSAGGDRVGLFTSPHLIRFNERMRVEGRDATDAELFEAFTVVRALAPWATDDPRNGADERSPRRGLTFFEWAVLLAAVHFERQGCDVAIFEAGLGGRWDGTTALPADLTVLTPIALDHQKILGDTLVEIAGEKVCAFRAGVPVVSAAQVPEVARTVEAAAAAKQAALKISGREASFAAGIYREGAHKVQARAPILAGRHQEENAGLAILGANTLRGLEGRAPLDGPALQAGLSRVRLPGRLQWVGDSLLCDGFHNRIGAEAAARALPALLGGRPLHLLFGCLRDRDPLSLLEPLLGLAQEVTLLTPRGDRALAASLYLEAVCARHPRVQEGTDLAEAIVRATSRPSASQDAPVALLGGSLYLVGEALAFATDGAPGSIDPGDPGHLFEASRARGQASSG